MAPADVAAHGARPVSFDELIEHADYLVIQAPLTKETYHRIGEAELRRMKPTLILVNTARGPIVNDDALYLALKEGWIAGGRPRRHRRGTGQAAGLEAGEPALRSGQRGHHTTRGVLLRRGDPYGP
jgi:hypothetical protein